MITAIIRAVIRFRLVVLAAGGGCVVAQRLRHPHRAARRDPRHLRSADHRLREVAAQPAAARNRGHRAADQRAGRLARHPVDPRHLAHGVLVHLRHPRERRRRATRAAARRSTASTPSGRSCRPTRASRSGPNASSMGWIYQYALVDREGTHDLRELRLLNESQIKPALQTVPGVAEVASVGGLEKQYQVKLFPPLLAERRHLAPAGHRRRPGRVSGSRRADDRGHQPRVSAARRRSTATTSTSSSSWSLGRDTDGTAGPPEGRRLHPGRLRPAPQHRRPRRHRRSGRRHRDHGAGPERAGRHRALEQKLQQIAPSLPAASRSSPPTTARPGSGRR